MSRTSTLTWEPIVHIIHALSKHDEYELAYSLLADYKEDIILSDEELVRIFEVLVMEGFLPDAKALLVADTDWIEELDTGFVD